MPVIPHSFQDNVDEIASGVQVDENLDVLNAAITALEAASAIGPTGGRTPRAFGAPNLASGTHNVAVDGDFNCPPGSFVHLLVGGQFVKEVGIPESFPGSERIGFSLTVPVGVNWEAVVTIFSVPHGSPSDLHSTYTPI